MKLLPPRRIPSRVLSLSLLILMSWGCTLFGSIRWLHQDLMIIQQGLTIGLIPMWIPDHSDSQASSWFDDWLFRRRRVYTLIRELHAAPADIVLWSEIVSQATGGVESEPQLLAFDQQRPELWQVQELENIGMQSQGASSSPRNWRVYSAVMSYLAENLLQDVSLPMTLLWLRPAEAAPVSEASTAGAFPYASYAMAAGFTFNNEPLLVLLVHLLPAHLWRYEEVQWRLMDLLAQHPQYCPGRTIISGYLPAYGESYTFNLPKPAPAPAEASAGPKRLAAWQPAVIGQASGDQPHGSGEGAETPYTILIPAGAEGQVSGDWLWPFRSPAGSPEPPQPLHHPLRLEVSSLPSCPAPESLPANATTS